MKLYKISGSSEYVDWDILHNQQGYSTSATNPVTWKSSLGNTWGETVADGYMEPTAASGWATKGFCLGKRGWHNMDDMANIYYVWPDIATSAKARHATWGESDVAVWDYDGTHTLYLVQKELEEGWMDEDTFAERGWEIVPDVPLGELVFVDASTGDVVYSVESLNEMAFTPTGYFTVEDDSEVLFVEQSPYPARGSLAKNYTPNATVADGSGIDTELPYYSQKLYIPVVVWHDENWNLGADYFGWDLSDSSGSIYATNNTGSSRIVISIIIAMIDATDAEIVEVKNQSDAHFYAFKWTSGGVPYWYVVDGNEDWTDDIEADGYEEVPAQNYIDVLLAMNYNTSTHDWASVTFSYTPNSNWWFACVTNAQDKAALENFGLSVGTVPPYSSDRFGPYGSLLYDSNFMFQILELYSDMGITPNTQAGINQFIARKDTQHPSDLLAIARDANDNITYMSWKCRVMPMPQTVEVILCLKWNQNTQDWLSVNFDYPIYDNYWWGCVKNTDDLMFLKAFGIFSAISGDGGCKVKFDGNYTWEVIDLYSDIGETPVVFDPSNFSISHSGDYVIIRCGTSFQTYCKSWKCRITRNS